MDQHEKERHVRWYRFLKGLVKRPVACWMRYRYEPVESVKTPFIVLANHNTDLDPLLVGFAFPEQMYFVASEHVFRKGVLSKLLVWVFAPISRIKGSTDAAAALEIIRRSRRGDNVCLFAEGNRSYNGVTGPVFPATGKLVKAAGATLYTYRLSGGYLASPRWGRFFRKGPTGGELIGTYSPKTLKGMTSDEVNAVIQRDLSEDAFERQRTEHQKYVGKAPAEYLETALYVCPKCGKIGTMKSEGDRFFCTDCGLAARYTDEGFLDGKDLPFDTVRDWDQFQTAHMEAFSKTLGTKEAFHDDGAVLRKLSEGHRATDLLKGRLVMTGGTLSMGELCFKIREISGMALFGRAKIAMTVGGEHYEIQFEPTGCGRKYLLLYQLLHG